MKTKEHPEIVAIVDDDELDIEELRQQLSKYLVTSYTTTKEFRNEVYNHMPDVLLLDYDIDDNHNECLEILREFKDSIPIMIVISAEPSRQIKRDCFLAGAIELISRHRAEDIAKVIPRLWRCRNTMLKMKEGELCKSKVNDEL